MTISSMSGPGSALTHMPGPYPVGAKAAPGDVYAGRRGYHRVRALSISDVPRSMVG